MLGYLGRWSEALDVAQRWPELAVRHGFGRLTEQVLTWHRLAHIAGLGRWTELDAELRRAAPIAVRNPDTTYALRYHAAMAALAAHRGDRAGVARAIEIARDAPHAAFPRAMVLADLALAAARVELGALAVDLSGEARASARSVVAPWPLARACLIGAAAARGSEQGDGLLAEALEITERWDYLGLWSRRERALAAPVLARALARGLGPAGVAARIAARCGDEVLHHVAELLDNEPAKARRELLEGAADAAVLDPRLVARLLRDRDRAVRVAAGRAQGRLLSRERTPLRVVTLGGFSVERPGTLLPEVVFSRRKARTLLAALLAGGGAVHRDLLLEWLWPDLAADRALAALHTTLHALRRSLQAGLGPRAADLIATDGEQYRLALGPRDAWDAEHFLALTRSLSEPVAHPLERALAAEAAYTGAFLPEWRYEDWTAPYRERIERARRQVLETVAEELVGAGRTGAAIGRYEQLAQLDPERERWHRRLMVLYAQAGERALALRQYHACRTQLRETLGIEPSAETRRLYESLL
jgi:DNA-binding SARP family transcriptional activator